MTLGSLIQMLRLKLCGKRKKQEHQMGDCLMLFGIVMGEIAGGMSIFKHG